MAQVNKSPKKAGAGNDKKIRDLNPPRVFTTANEFDKYAALAVNAIKIECTDPAIKFGYLEERFIKQQLVFTNYVGYDRLINMWAKAYAYGLNDYWQAKTVTFVFPNRKGYTRELSYEPKPIGAYLIQGYPGNITLASIIQKATDTMQICDSAIIQNLEASKTPHYVLVKDEDTRLSLEQAIQQRQAGKPVIVVDETLGDCMKGVPNLTEFVVPQIYEFRTSVRNDLLNELATMTANTNKRERVQVGEVNAMVGLCEDHIYSLIDNIERQFKEYDLPFKISLNTSLEELYYNSINNNDNNPEETDEYV